MEIIYGDGIYLWQSSICLAAKHFGLLKDTGKKIELQFKIGEKTYDSTLQNGVQSKSWTGDIT